MPLSHRKGMEAKATERDKTRRSEAKENGIILEKQSNDRKKTVVSNKRKEKGVGAPSVGKFSKGMLRLSKKDVEDIQGQRTMGNSKQRNGRRGSGRL